MCKLCDRMFYMFVEGSRFIVVVNRAINTLLGFIRSYNYSYLVTHHAWLGFL